MGNFPYFFNIFVIFDDLKNRNPSFVYPDHHLCLVYILNLLGTFPKYQLHMQGVCKSFFIINEQGPRNELFSGEAAKKFPFFVPKPLKFLFSKSLKFG